MTQCMEGDEAGGWWKVGLLNQLGGAGEGVHQQGWLLQCPITQLQEVEWRTASVQTKPKRHPCV